jgi:hypothetical protein
MVKQTQAISESGWNFKNVADDEVVACYLWEYARESRTMALATGLPVDRQHARAAGVLVARR